MSCHVSYSSFGNTLSWILSAGPKCFRDRCGLTCFQELFSFSAMDKKSTVGTQRFRAICSDSLEFFLEAQHLTLFSQTAESRSVRLKSIFCVHKVASLLHSNVWELAFLFEPSKKIIPELDEMWLFKNAIHNYMGLAQWPFLDFDDLTLNKHINSLINLHKNDFGKTF